MMNYSVQFWVERERETEAEKNILGPGRVVEISLRGVLEEVR